MSGFEQRLWYVRRSGHLMNVTDSCFCAGDLASLLHTCRSNFDIFLPNFCAEHSTEYLAKKKRCYFWRSMLHLWWLWCFSARFHVMKLGTWSTKHNQGCMTKMWKIKNMFPLLLCINGVTWKCPDTFDFERVLLYLFVLLSHTIVLCSFEGLLLDQVRVKGRCWSYCLF